MRHPPRQAMWSLRGLRPPVHRKLSVTATFGSVAVTPPVFNTWLMHSSLCSDRVSERNTECLLIGCSCSVTASIVSLCREASPRRVWASQLGACGSGTWASQSADSAGTVLLVACGKMVWSPQRSPTTTATCWFHCNAGRVAAPCSVQVNFSLRASLVSLVQGMQIGLRRRGQAHALPFTATLIQNWKLILIGK